MTFYQHRYLREMRKAAKKSKTFEIQRLVKKLKYLRKPTHASGTTVLKDLEDLETQLHSLKKTDHERVAYLALSSKIHKDSKLRSNDALMALLTSAMSNTTNANTEARHAKVESRFLSSKILASEAQEAVKGLRATLEPSTIDKAHRDVQTLDPNEGQERVEDEVNEDGYERELTILEEVVDEADHLVADDGWESGSIDGIEHARTGDEEESSSPRQNPKQLSSLSILGPLNPSKSAASSTFLPSLSVGYIKGDSDSDIDLSDGETAASGRKNRRGQRARQAIWEKKYGKNATHLKKQREVSQSSATARALGKHSDKGWESCHHDDHPTRTPARVTKNKRLARMHSKGQLEKHLPSEKPMHPSWEAKRKLKERESARILPAQGKKIVFN